MAMLIITHPTCARMRLFHRSNCSCDRQCQRMICRPLELDTDGIWCCLPGSFPEEFKFTTAAGKTVKINYPGLMLNVMCADNNTNEQYHDLVKRPDGSSAYEVSSQMSIEFEVDGPYLVRPTLPCAYVAVPRSQHLDAEHLHDSCLQAFARAFVTSVELFEALHALPKTPDTLHS